MPCETFSQRVLCPCHGMLQVVSVEGGVAESVDGYCWKLFVADERIISHTGLSEVRYGDWTPRSGSSRSKIRGATAWSMIEETGERIIEALEGCADQVPFQPMDKLEYWLLDEQTQRPLALLESRARLEQPINIDSPHWHPGAAAKRQFQSEYGDADSLMGLIQQRAGSRPAGLWVERADDGTGRQLNGDELDSQYFPELFLSTDWPNPEQTRLAKDFLAWQAPWLLQMHHLNPSTRDWLEQAAWQRPLETSKVFRLFPRVVDTQGLTVTRVKARLLSEEKSTVGSNEPFYPFYNE